ncbi:hypothetical protein SXCC_00383 [Gluconacetobacter sp. SXCC-1]|nr:hypothetical protein SXCC_00383 [Gluconacetobacter sp. SXCC-1]
MHTIKHYTACFHLRKPSGSNPLYQMVACFLYVIPPYAQNICR